MCAFCFLISWTKNNAIIHTEDEKGSCKLRPVLCQQHKGVLGCSRLVRLVVEGTPQELCLLLVLRRAQQPLHTPTLNLEPPKKKTSQEKPPNMFVHTKRSPPRRRHHKRRAKLCPYKEIPPKKKTSQEKPPNMFVHTKRSNTR